MEICRTKEEISKYTKTVRLANKKSIGFVPTMGALHEGHLKLVKKSQNENNITIVSIFVNPEQFNNKSDYEKYPVTIETDIEKLRKTNCDVVFIPSVEDIYPEKDNRKFDLQGLDSNMEGKYRPGHFEGVVKVVSILFDIISPNNAYFGEKDFQQLAIIKYATGKYQKEKNIKVHSCETIRETDGLAMSSRNMRLNSEQRSVAPVIYKTLVQSKELTHLPITDIKEFVIKEINKTNALKVEYFEIVDSKNLSIISKLDSEVNYRACIAVFAGEVRLIDNIEYSI